MQFLGNIRSTDLLDAVASFADLTHLGLIGPSIGFGQGDSPAQKCPNAPLLRPIVECKQLISLDFSHSHMDLLQVNTTV